MMLSDSPLNQYSDSEESISSSSGFQVTIIKAVITFQFNLSLFTVPNGFPVMWLRLLTLIIALVDYKGCYIAAVFI